jgi:hypothetical protein
MLQMLHRSTQEQAVNSGSPAKQNDQLSCRKLRVDCAGFAQQGV